MPFVTPAVLKIFIGISHVMIMLELSIRVKQSILLYDLNDPELLSDEKTENLYKRKEKMDRDVNLIRLWLSFCIVVIGVTVIVVDRIMSYQTSITSDPRGSACLRYQYLYTASKAIGSIFLILFLAFALSILKLVVTLRMKFRKVDLVGFQNVFSKEFKTLLLLLMVFSTSYLIRFLCDVVPLKVFPDDFIQNEPPCPHRRPA